MSNTRSQNEIVKLEKTAIREKFDPRNISTIQYLRTEVIGPHGYDASLSHKDRHLPQGIGPGHYHGALQHLSSEPRYVHSLWAVCVQMTDTYVRTCMYKGRQTNRY